MSSPKKLVYILNYVNADDTQHFVHVLNLLTRLKQLGWSVVLISEKGGKGTRSVLGHEVLYMSENGKWSRLIRLGWTLAKLRRQGYRLVFVRISKTAALVASSLSRPFGWQTLFWLSGAIADFNDRKPWPRRAYEAAVLRMIFTLTHRFVSGPEAMIRYYQTEYRVPRHKCLLLYNDIDIGTFTPAPAPASSDGLSILLLHRLSPVRETTRYMPAIIATLGEHVAARRSPIRLDIVGDGPERAALEAAAASVPDGLRVIFHGAVPNRRVREFYTRADVFIMPSYREGFPRVIIEAMAMGLPIVSTDAGGTRDLFGPLQQEFVVPRDDSGLFADSLKRLLSDGEKRRGLSQENVREVKRFSTESVAQMYDSALSALLAAPLDKNHSKHV